MTFGFQSAVDIATDTIDRIHTTATSHSRVFIIEIMGHKVGHVTLHAGIAGGADIILLPEIPYDIKAISDVIQKRTKAGKKFTILAVAEGAISKEDAKLKKKEYKESLQRENILLLHTSWLNRLRRQQIRRFELQFRDIHSAAVLHVHMIVYLQQESELRQQS